jgi:two-component system chemotaxis sensor kinase CheA
MMCCTFFAESRGLLGEMESALMSLEREPGDVEAIHAVFRAAHTIKGSAGLFGLDEIVGFTHTWRPAGARALGQPGLHGDMVGLLLQCGDHIHRLIDAAGDAAAGRAPARRRPMLGQTLIERLRAGPAAGAAPAARPRPPRCPAPSRPVASVAALLARPVPGRLRSRALHPPPAHPGPGGAHRHPEHPAAHAGGDGPESCYLGFEIRLASAAGKQEIESVFEFVSQDCELRILPPDSRVDDYLRLIEALPADRLRLGEILLACGALTEHELGRALDEQRAEPDAGRAPLGEILVEERAVQPELVQGAIGRRTSCASASRRKPR